jgi:hypothetical protein
VNTGSRVERLAYERCKQKKNVVGGNHGAVIIHPFE